MGRPEYEALNPYMQKFIPSNLNLKQTSMKCKHKGCTTMLHIIDSAYDELPACVYTFCLQLVLSVGSMGDPLQLGQGNFEIVANNKK